MKNFYKMWFFLQKAFDTGVVNRYNDENIKSLKDKRKSKKYTQGGWPQ